MTGEQLRARNHLLIINDLFSEIQDLEKEYKRVSGNLLPSPNYGREHIKNNGIADTTYKTAEKLASLKEQIIIKKLDLLDAKHELLNDLFQIKNTLQLKILYFYYLEPEENYTFKKLAKKLNCSYDHAVHLHTQALASFAEILSGKETKEAAD